MKISLQNWGMRLSKQFSNISALGINNTDRNNASLVFIIQILKIMLHGFREINSAIYTSNSLLWISIENKSKDQENV